MGKPDTNIPSPDPNIGKAALLSAEVGQQWLGFAKDAFKVSTDRQKELDALSREVTDLQMGVARDQATWSREDRQRYEKTFKPLEDKFLKEAATYDTPEKQAEAAATAKADVMGAAADREAAASRQAMGLGIDPRSGRYAGIDRAGDMATQLQSAGSQNAARQQVRDRGLALRADAVNLGRGLPAQAAQAAGLGVNAGSQAAGVKGAANGQYIASTGIVNAGYGGAQQGYAQQGSLLNQQYGNQINAWQAQQQASAANSAGIGSALGGLAGLFMMSDEDAKEDKEEIPEGEALDAVNAMPVEKWKYKPGVADEGEHVGTYAQDFQEQTGQGDGTTIPVQDAIGVTMKAVQDLDAKVEKIAKAVGIGLAPARDPDNPASRGPIQKARKPEIQKAGPAGLGRMAA